MFVGSGLNMRKKKPSQKKGKSSKPDGNSVPELISVVK
jgi:hypothetical protein